MGACDTPDERYGEKWTRRAARWRACLCLRPPCPTLANQYALRYPQDRYMLITEL